jgi:HD-GYP domain-containing protein (c-di-GMP phosphodiesterase class II)
MDQLFSSEQEPLLDPFLLFYLLQTILIAERKSIVSEDAYSSILKSDELLRFMLENSQQAAILFVNRRVVFSNAVATRLLFCAEGWDKLIADVYTDLLADFEPELSSLSTTQAESNADLLFTNRPAHFRSSEGEVVSGLATASMMRYQDSDVLALVIRPTKAALPNPQIAETKGYAELAARLARLAVSGSLIHEVMQAGVELLAQALNFGAAILVEYRPVLDEYHCVVGYGWKRSQDHIIEVAVDRRSPSFHAIMSGQIVVVEDVDVDERFVLPDHVSSKGIRSTVSLPIEGEGNPYGVLNFYQSQPRRYSTAEIEFLKSSANILSAAVKRHQVDLEKERIAKRLQVQNEITRAILDSHTNQKIACAVIAHLQDLLPCTYISVIELDAFEQNFSVLASVSREPHAALFEACDINGFPEELIKKLKTGPIYSDDFKKFAAENKIAQQMLSLGIEVFFSDLIKVAGISVGALNIGFTLHDYDPQAAEIIHDVTQTLSIAFKQTTMTEAEERRLNQLEALHCIDQSIINHESFRYSLPLVVEQVMSCCKMDASVILLYAPDTKTLHYAASKGFRNQRVTETVLNMGEGIGGKSAQQMRMIYAHSINEVDADFFDHPILDGEDFVAYFSLPLIVKDQLKGVLEVFNRSPITADKTWIESFQALGTQAAILIDNKELFDGMQKANAELVQAYNSTIEGWSLALDLRDKETEGHTLRVADMAVKFAQRIGVEEDQIVHILRGSLLHDIGKVAVPDGILLKEGALSPEEWEIMRRHPVHAYELISHIDYLQPAIDIPHFHHEKWDGSGYPCGLKGFEIPLAARLFSIIDVYDALSSDRPYRAAWSKLDVLSYISEQAGKHFDPVLVEAFLDFIETYSLENEPQTDKLI